MTSKKLDLKITHKLMAAINSGLKSLEKSAVEIAKEVCRLSAEKVKDSGKVTYKGFRIEDTNIDIGLHGATYTVMVSYAINGKDDAVDEFETIVGDVAEGLASKKIGINADEESIEIEFFLQE